LSGGRTCHYEPQKFRAQSGTIEVDVQFLTRVLVKEAFLTIGALPRGELGNWIICTVSIVAALAVSAASYRWIELPFNRMGHAYVPREAVIAPAIVSET
jgi:peptidoglycan/LPS O-acetylase OafA/YrhL